MQVGPTANFTRVTQYIRIGDASFIYTSPEIQATHLLQFLTIYLQKVGCFKSQIILSTELSNHPFEVFTGNEQQCFRCPFKYCLDCLKELSGSKTNFMSRSELLRIGSTICSTFRPLIFKCMVCWLYGHSEELL